MHYSRSENVSGRLTPDSCCLLRAEEEIHKAVDYRCRAHDWKTAATVLLTAADALSDDFQTDDPLAALTPFKA